jgi:hypothetical protein
MSEKLLESDGLMTNLRMLFSKVPEATVGETSTETEKTAIETPKEDSLEAWKAKLAALKFTPVIIEKLNALGEPFKKALEVLGWIPRKNPLLAFVAQEWVQKNLLLTDLLNASTFRAIYNALATRQVAGSEFLKANDYNIIYCRDLYSKSATEMANYLELQKSVLDPNAETGKYTTATLRNRKVFFQIKNLNGKDLNPSRSASKLSDISDDKVPKARGTSTKLNGLDFVKKASGKDLEPTTSLSGAKQDALVKLLQTPATKYAAILALAMTTNSSQAKEALKKDIFNTLSSDDVRNATVSLASRDIMPKGKLNKSDADSLVAKIIASLT